jgi:deazaflavin-dependent oxidoreductase (nitroreductase family)
VGERGRAEPRHPLARPLLGIALGTGSLGTERGMSAWSPFAGEEYCYLTTRGRVTGRPRRIEIWFALEGSTLYLLSGGRERADWVRNLRASPEAMVELGTSRFAGSGRMVEDEAEDERARTLVHDKYARSYAGDLSGWRRSALAVAVDLRDEDTTTEERSR